MRKRRRTNRKWTPREDRYLMKHYPDGCTKDICAKLRRTERSLWARVRKLGVTKSDEFKAEVARRCSAAPGSIATRFKPGSVSPNKGKRWYQFMSEEAHERQVATQFKPGMVPSNTAPVGYESIDRDGYVRIKAEQGRPMVFKHHWVWEQHHGKRPRGMIMAFRDGNRRNCDIGNLELITRSEMRRRQLDAETPEQRKCRLDKIQASRNETIRKDKMRIRWGLEPRTKVVKKWYAPTPAL